MSAGLSLRLAAAITVGKLVTFASRRLNLGGGTTLPGEIARRIDPLALRKLARRLPQGSIVVTGTNGKTTTARLIAHILQAAGLSPVHNRSGANLISGITSTVLNAASLIGNPVGDIGLFEVDEANLPRAVVETAPAVVVINNLFRDQLDRYGEIDFVASLWRKALAALPSAATVILNADDPLVASLGEDIRNERAISRGIGNGPIRTLYFGIDDERYGRSELEHAADSKSCVKCGFRYAYSVAFYGHIGKYHCPNCGKQRPQPDIAASRVTLLGTAGTQIFATTPNGMVELETTLPGLYNVYNVLAAVAVGIALGLSSAQITAGIARFSAAFGRVERVRIGNKLAFLALVKNPIGFNEVLRTVLHDADRRTTPSVGVSDVTGRDLLIIINDNIADGTDISWLWDVDFEMLQGRVRNAIISGTRAEDMAVRLKYAGVDPSLLLLEKDLDRALHIGLTNVPDGGTLYILPTYTAMLQVRDVMQRHGYVGKFWQD